jgi:hypothetical protein
VTRAIKGIDALSKKLSGMKKDANGTDTEGEKEKAMDDKEEETTKSAEIDQFVGSLAGFVSALEGKFAKSNIRVPGLDRMIVDAVRNDPEVQKSIKEMIKQPGAKKSVAGGVAWFPTKEGRRFALTATEQTVQKSTATPTGKNAFKELYNERFSTLAQSEE